MSRGSRGLGLSFLMLVWGVGCRPAFEDRSWLVTKQEIVGWTADPPEAPPGTSIAVQVVALDPAGPPDTTGTTWTLCHAAKPLDEARVVTPDCLIPGSPDAVGSPVALVVPADACEVYGPDTPQPLPGDPPTRPHDPDATGGYYQPVTISFGASVAVGLERVTCDLPGASFTTAQDFEAAYHLNQNPIISGLTLTVAGAAADPGAIPAGAPVGLEIAWPVGSAESFPVFDPASTEIIETEEMLFVSWFVTGGQLDRAAATISDPAILSTETVWEAPASGGAFEIVVILRDSRGGSAVLRRAVVVAAF